MDLLTRATFALHSGRGIYAMLVGSGVSSAAGVPTGHAVMLDLIRQLALLRGEVCDPAPEAWYERTYQRRANYSEILEALASTPAERQALLRPFFEPTDEEASQSLKMPGPTHRAIARLVSLGYIRIVVTTNFDRLIERALEEAGVAPVVASTEGHSAGCAPLTHQRALVLKVNGDYLDLSLRNSPNELEAYSPAVEKLVEQVFEEYGLIVCGWSATYDVGLRKVLERTKSRRYSIFWINRGSPSDEASQLIRRREAQFVQATGEAFLPALADGLESLIQFGQTDPISRQVALARAKRFLGELKHDVELRELLSAEALRVSGAVGKLPDTPSIHDAGAVIVRIQTCDGITDLLRCLFFTIAHFGQARHLDTLLRTLRMAAPAPPTRHTSDFLTPLHDYPGMILFYSAGVGAIAAGNYDLAYGLLCAGRQPSQRQANEFVERWYAELISNHPRSPINHPELTGVMEPNRHSLAPLSAHVHRLLRDLTVTHMSESQLTEAYDRWDMVVSMFRAHCQQFHGDNLGVGLGLFAFRGGVLRDTLRDLEELGKNWPPLSHGLFSGDPARVTALHEQIIQAAQRAR